MPSKIRLLYNQAYLSVKNRIPQMIGFLINTWSFIAPNSAARITMFFYTKPMEGKILRYHEKFLNSADEAEKLDFEDSKIQTYFWKGTGKTVLLLHGWESNTWRWRKMIPYLKELDLNIIAMDAPAHGKTEGKRFTAVIYAAMIDKVVAKYNPDFIIGHSIGAMTGLYYITHYDGHKIKDMVVMASPNKWEDVANRFHTALRLSDRVIKYFDIAFNEIFDKPQTYYSAEDFVTQIDIPGFLIHDEDDTFNLVEDGRAIAKKWKNVTYWETKGIGHSLQAREVYERVKSYMQQAIDR